MSEIALLTPSYFRDFARCQLLCETIDQHVTGYSMHYIVVNDADFQLFEPLRNEKRTILKYSDVIPKRLKVIPRIFKQDYWVSLNALPLKGWHVQQIVKIAMTMKMREDRVLIIDSDMAFVRDFDLSHYKSSSQIPLLQLPQEIKFDHPSHATWIKNACKLLGLKEPDFPACDYIGNAVFWDKAVVKEMVIAIEKTTGISWSLALQRTRKFSEYMIYGYFVEQSFRHNNIHHFTRNPLFKTYWGANEISEKKFRDMIQDLAPHQVIIGVQSFGKTSQEMIKKVLRERL